MDDAVWRAITIVVSIVGGLIAVVYGLHRSTQSKLERKVDDHDARLAKVETKVERIEDEVDGLRKRWHDLRETTLRELWELFHEKLEALRKLIRK